jgi:hypothetical protein
MINTYRVITLSIMQVLFVACTTVAQESSPSKESYSIFNRTPDSKMRDFATDRPDKTESAYTLDAGHFMHETDLFNYSHNQDNGVRTDSFFMFAPNLKVGLTNNTDLQLVYQPYVYNRERDVSSKRRVTTNGSGDLVIRLKTNMWGNDGGDSAGAIMPYVKAPTARSELGNGAVEGGIIMPFAFDLGDDVGMGLMTQVDVLRNDSDSDYYSNFVNSATIGTPLIGELSGYAEVWSSVSSETDAEVTLDFGTTYMINENTQFDMGLNVGATPAADDLNPFVGISQRF